MGALRDFVAELLEHEGAAVEPFDPDGLAVLAPPALQGSFGWQELTRLGFGATLPAGAIPIGLDGEWLDRFGGLIGERGRFVERQLVLPATPPDDPQRLLGHALVLPNAVWRFVDARPAWARCLILAFRYAAVSDEKREGLVWLGFNQTTGAVLDDTILEPLRRLLAENPDWHPIEPEAVGTAGPGWNSATLLDRVRPLLDRRIRRDLEPFVRAMRRRLDRDSGRIHQYHDDLRRAAQSRLIGAGTAADEKAESSRHRESMRIAAIEREYAAKLEDLRHNYALHVTVQWVQGLVLLAPVQRYDVLIKRRKGERTVSIDWHPAVRQMELPPSDWGLGLERARLVCDDRLHLTEAAGQAPCPSCGKVWCRACQPAACPRCGQATEHAPVR
jgi:hypothetical protein